MKSCEQAFEKPLRVDLTSTSSARQRCPECDELIEQGNLFVSFLTHNGFMRERHDEAVRSGQILGSFGDYKRLGIGSDELKDREIDVDNEKGNHSKSAKVKLPRLVKVRDLKLGTKNPASTADQDPQTQGEYKGARRKGIPEG